MLQSGIPNLHKLFDTIKDTAAGCDDGRALDQALVFLDEKRDNCRAVSHELRLLQVPFPATTTSLPMPVLLDARLCVSCLRVLAPFCFGVTAAAFWRHFVSV
jgi:hypothetical protein